MDNGEKQLITVIIPCRNEARYIARCLDSIIQNEYPKDKLELFVVDGMSTDETQAIIEKYVNTYSFITLLKNHYGIVPFAMNIGISHAAGSYIVRLDAHCVYPVDYLSKLIWWAEKLDAENVGGVWITDVLTKNNKTQTIVNVLTCRFGVGNAYFRLGIDQPTLVDTVPFGCYKRAVFQQIGLYDERLKRNQDIELNKRLTKAGGKIFLIPEIRCVYYARETYNELLYNNFQNGLWNILTAYYTKTFFSLSFRHYVPFFFVVYLLCLAFLLLNTVLWLIPLVVYVGLNLFFTLRIAVRERNLMLIPYLVYTFLVLHLSYGCGSLFGFGKIFLFYVKK